MASSVTGVKELTDKMAHIRQQMREQAARKAVRAAGRVIQSAMVERTPVLIEKSAGSDSLDPGEVKAGIRVRVTQQGDDAVSRIGPIGKDGLIPRTAHLVEYGHRMVVGGRSRMNSFGAFVGPGKALAEDVPPHPFLRPAFEASAAEAMESLASTLSEELRKAAE